MILKLQIILMSGALLHFKSVDSNIGQNITGIV